MGIFVGFFVGLFVDVYVYAYVDVYVNLCAGRYCCSTSLGFSVDVAWRFIVGQWRKRQRLFVDV